MRTTIARLASFGLAVALTSTGCAGTDHEDERALSQESALSDSDPVSAATTSGCTTAVVRGLGTQLVDEIQCMKPGSMSKIDDVPNVAPLSADVFPFLQTPARTALVAVAASRGVPLNINSALRSLPEQYILYRWYKLGRCSIQLAATPGTSNHESGLALDVDDNAGWRTAMQSHDYQWLGASDVVHYDYVGAGAIDMKGLSVLAFQKLWNRNHPEDPIAEDSSYGQETETRLAKSPLGGFLKGASCKEPDAGTPAAPDASTPEPPARGADAGAGTGLDDDALAADSNGCSMHASRRGRGSEGLALLLGLGIVVGARRARRHRHAHAAVATGCAALLLASGCSDDASVDTSEPPGETDAGAASSNDAAAAAETSADAATQVDADAAPPKPEPDVDTIPWQTGGNVGFGVASKDTQNPRGNNAALVYGGYQSTLANAEGWTTALYKAELKNRGVRWLYAVQGPNTVQYVNKEIGNTSILAALLPKVNATTKFVLVLGHSSGSFVAHELLGQVAGTFDPNGVLTGKLVYFDLDGGRDGFTPAVATRMRKAYFVSPKDVAKGTLGFNNASMESAGTDYAALGGTLPFDSTTAGCNAGANGCIHVSLVIDKPHSPAGATVGQDYDDFSGGRAVTTRYLVQKGTEAGLVP